MDERVGGMLCEDAGEQVEMLWALLLDKSIGIEEASLDVATMQGWSVPSAVWRDFG